MSSLADRLAAARQAEQAAADADAPQGPDAGAPPTADAASTTPAAAPAAGSSAVAAAARRTAPEPPRKTRLTSQQGDRIEELKQSVHTELLKQLGPQLYDADMDQDQLDQRVRAVLADVLSAQDRPLSSSDRQRVTQEISDDILGYGPIEPYLRDPDVSEVMVNGHKDIWLERKGKLVPADAHFADEAHLPWTAPP